MGTTVVIDGRPWTLGRSMGSGGYGEVYAAESHGRWAAIKLVPKKRGASRELLFADNLRGAENVFPIDGKDQTESHWALLMPMTDMSLRDYLHESGGRLGEAEAIPILADIARALASLQKTGVVHRDLKPENILWYEDRWCLSDFGIARYVDAVTSADTATRKGRTPRPYAAPEQWREEKPTAASDVYAFGIISYELLTGSWPFSGSEFDFRDQHLHWDPPVIPGISPLLASLIEECLNKAPGVRPSPQKLLDYLRAVQTTGPVRPGPSALQEANRVATRRQAQEARRQSEARTEAERRAALLDVARSQYNRIHERLEQAIMSAAPACVFQKTQRYDLSICQITLGSSELVFSDLRPAETPSNQHPDRAFKLSFDVIAYGHIATYGHVDRAHSLWYCNAEDAKHYGWYEFASFVFKRPENEYAHPLNPLASHFSTALAILRNPGSYPVGFPLTSVNVGQLDDFIDRWATWFAEASQDQLERPSIPRASDRNSDTSETRAPQVEAEPSEHKSVRAVPSALIVCIVLALVAGVAAWVVHGVNLQRPRYTSASSPAGAGAATHGTRTTTLSPSALPSAPQSARVFPGGKTILVPSTIDPRPAGGGTDTGLSVRQGHRLIITATGKAQYGAENTGDHISVFCSGERGVAYTDPNGDVTVGSADCNEKKFDQYCPMPNAPLGSLIARIGNGAWFLVGADYDAASPATGELWLGYNDSSPEGNSGSFSVSIST